MKILKIKDVVMVALLTALYFIIYNIAGMLAMVFGAFGHAISPGICGLFCGIIMYFVSKKVGKFLQFTLMQAIIIVLFTIMGAGYIPWVITSLVAALIADIIASREMNPAVWKLGIASGVFHVGQALGSIVPAMFFMESYMEDWIARGQTAEQMDAWVEAASGVLGVLAIVVVFVLAFAGIYVGYALLKKHFEKIDIRVAA